jgi:hypothetical protein
MLSGFNTNVRHRGLLLHVQTEDSGRANPHIITHLYHGGTILASERSEYDGGLGSSDLADEVRRRMEDQHRAMLRRLKRGELDARLVERLGRQAFPDDTGAATASGATGPTSPAVEESGEAVVLEAEVPRTSLAGGARPLDEVVLEYLVERAARPRRPAS